jgi:hypothetical protein
MRCNVLRDHDFSGHSTGAEYNPPVREHGLVAHRLGTTRSEYLDTLPQAILVNTAKDLCRSPDHKKEWSSNTVLVTDLLIS